MIDLHTHSFKSDGVLAPAELARQAEVVGYKAIAITDHADFSNFEELLNGLLKLCPILNEHMNITVFPGIEITYVPPAAIGDIAGRARELGAQIIGVHGETIAEVVPPGTNKAALLSDIDFLAHPGLISVEDVKLAAERNIPLEITTRRGHSLTNGHVAKLAKEYGAPMVMNNDAHGPGDFVSKEMQYKIGMGAGLSSKEVDTILSYSWKVVDMELQKQINIC